MSPWPWHRVRAQKSVLKEPVQVVVAGVIRVGFLGGGVLGMGVK